MEIALGLRFLGHSVHSSSCFLVNFIKETINNVEFLALYLLGINFFLEC